MSRKLEANEPVDHCGAPEGYYDDLDVLAAKLEAYYVEQELVKAVEVRPVVPSRFNGEPVSPGETMAPLD